MTAVRERGIPMTAWSVIATLEGRKTMTRRIAKLRPGQEVEGGAIFLASDPFAMARCPYGQVGDRLWVREAFRCDVDLDDLAPSMIGEDAEVQYEADGARRHGRTSFAAGRYRHARFMPRWASRIDLELLKVRVERVQDITEEDAKAEGVAPSDFQESWSCMRRDGSAFDCFVEPDAEDRKDLVAVVHKPARECISARGNFRRLWEHLHGPGAWERNEYVWVLAYRMVTPCVADVARAGVRL